MAATLKVHKHVRSWNNNDLYDTSDVIRLFDEEKVRTTKPGSCVRYWSVYLTILGFFTLFLIGSIILGFYLRDDQNVPRFCRLDGSRVDGFDDDTLQAVHNNIMFYMTSQNIHRYIRDLAKLKHSTTSKSPLDWDYHFAKYVENHFKKFGFHKVDVQERDIVVTYPDPSQPNRLGILHANGSVSRNISIGRNIGIDKGNNSVNRETELPPFVAFSPSGQVKGPVVDANEGWYLDFLKLNMSNFPLMGAIPLIKMDGKPLPEKIRLAEQFGCAAVLLYCPSMNLSCYHDNHAPSASAAMFQGPGVEPYYPSIPVQTVSLQTAKELLTSLDTLHHHDEQLEVELIVNASQGHKVKVLNVVGTLYGGVETDRQVIIRGGLQRWPSLNKDLHSSTALLLELARTFTEIHQEERWRPRRRLKFVFTGGAYLSDVGLDLLMNEGPSIKEDTVTLVDLEDEQPTQGLMSLHSSPGLLETIKLAKAMVPDPRNSNKALDTVSPDMSAQEVYASEKYQILDVGKATLTHPMMLRYGVPVVTISPSTLPYQSLGLGWDPSHHLGDLLATARVTSRILLGLLDKSTLPFDVRLYAQHLDLVVNRSADQLKSANLQSCVDISSLLGAVQNFSLLSERIASKSHWSCQGQRNLNDHLMRLDSSLAIPSTGHMLPINLQDHSRQTGSLLKIEEAFKMFHMTNNTNAVCEIVENLTSIIKRNVYELMGLVSS